MKKIFLSLCTLFCCISIPVNAQKDPIADDKIASISGLWKQENETIYVQKIIDLEGLNKDIIFNKVLEFMTRTYKDASEVIQVKEKENGLLVGKGTSYFYVNEIFKGSAVKQTIWHIFKAEVKDNKARITISIHTVNWNVEASQIGNTYISAKNGEYPLTACYPIGNDESKKKRSGYVFYHAVNNIINLLDSCENFLKLETETASSDDW